MEFIRRAANPWGQDIMIGLAWNVLWLVVVAGALFVVVHAILKARAGSTHTEGAPGEGGAALPPKVTRHNLSARISHWILAAATLTLLVTAFVPILGLQFPWVTIHWIAGLVFGAYVVYHTVDTLSRKSLGSMWISVKEFGQASTRLKEFMGGDGDPDRPGKWGFENKAFHHVTALAGLAALATGIAMFMRVDTWFWVADPYVLGFSDSTWGFVYVLHGIASVAFVGLLIAHIYFAVRPDNFWITRSMFKGWITRDEFLEHHDPDKWTDWKPADGRRESEAPAEGAPVGSGRSASSTDA